jgi:hypothetical protein
MCACMCTSTFAEPQPHARKSQILNPKLSTNQQARVEEDELKLSELENVSKFMMNLVRARIDSVRTPDPNTKILQGRKHLHVTCDLPIHPRPSCAAVFLYSIHIPNQTPDDEGFESAEESGQHDSSTGSRRPSGDQITGQNPKPSTPNPRHSGD